MADTDWDALMRRLQIAPADATRAPSGLTQQLQKDVERKRSVLAQEGDRPGLPIQNEDDKIATARNTASFPGRTTGPLKPIGDTSFGWPTETKQDEQRDYAVREVGRSLDATEAKLAAAKKADDTRRGRSLTDMIDGHRP